LNLTAKARKREELIGCSGFRAFPFVPFAPQTHFQPTDHTDHTEMQGFVSFSVVSWAKESVAGPTKDTKCTNGNEFTAKARKREGLENLCLSFFGAYFQIRAAHELSRKRAIVCPLIYGGRIGALRLHSWLLRWNAWLKACLNGTTKGTKYTKDKKPEYSIEQERRLPWASIRS